MDVEVLSEQMTEALLGLLPQGTAALAHLQ